jgi:hypothetical protein
MRRICFAYKEYKVNKPIPIESLPLEQQVESLRQHVLMFTGYALSLAEKMAMSPGDAALLFMESLTPSAQLVSLESQAKGDALRMSMIHGLEKVQLTQHDENWLIQIQVDADQPILEQWGVSISFWADWLARQAEVLGQAKGIKYVVWLDSETLNIQLEST